MRIFFVRTARSTLLWLALCGAASLAAGCQALPAGVIGDGCRTDEDCWIGVCNLERRCAPRCTVDGDCPLGASCLQSVCVGQLVPGDGGREAEDGGAALGEDGGAMTLEDGGSAALADGGATTGLVDGGGTTVGGDGGGTTVRGDGGTVLTGDGGRAEQCHDRGARRVCGSSLGTCRTGEQECNGEFWGPCLGAVGPSTEQCDGEDHDCDGIPNNPLGGCDCQSGQTRACYNGPEATRGVGACRDGSQTCTLGRWEDCTGAIIPLPGRCDVRSCDGLANPGCTCAVGETRSCFSGAQSQVGVGICRAGTQACVAQGVTAVWGTCTGEILPKAEKCDGTDQNCDGTADNRATPPCDCRNGATRGCYDGPPETRNVGTCRDGTQTCTDGRWADCVGAVQPLPGSCLQASCAGSVNPGCACIPGEARMCYSSNAREIGVGICRSGTETCVRGSGGAVQWGPCVGERLPEVEQCDGLDHNCNGIPNDRAGGCTCTNGAVRDCYDGPAGTEGVGTCRKGSAVCSNGGWGACQSQVIPIPGRCDVLSCAGGPNPGCLCTLGDSRSCYSGAPTQVNVGICRSGAQRCVSFDTGGVGWGTCLGERLPEAEQCDGQDHDCNGALDDRTVPTACECRNGQTRACYNGPPGTLGVGTCAAGSQSCVDGRWGSCGGAIEPRAGQCGVAACTGANDANPGCACIIGRAQACYDGAPATLNIGICRGGTQTCNGTTTGSAWGACQNQRLPETERCDNQDHDCNGVLNDRPGGCVCVLGQSQSCYSGPPGTAGVGTCRAGSQSCVTNAAGGFEWGACSGEVKPITGNCAVASCTGANDPNPGCSCINARTQTCYTGPSGTVNQGICLAGSQVCAAGSWAACTGQVTPDLADTCVPPSAVYATYKTSDRTCNGLLDRHNPVATPTLNAPSGQPLSPLPAGAVSGLTVEPLDTINFVGGATDQDGSGPFSYRWRLLSAPQNNSVGLSGAPGATTADYTTAQSPTLFAQLAGDYVVGVTATDGSGCPSAEVQVAVRVKPHSAIHLQLTWDRSVDMDIQLIQTSTALAFGTNACYWGRTDPAWGTVSPHLDIDDLAGCNPENINFGAIGGTLPPVNTAYGVFVHYWCDHRGHRYTSSTTGSTTAVCYEPTAYSGTPKPIATMKIFVDGNLAKIDGSSVDAVFTKAMDPTMVWKPANLLYDATGVWRVQVANTTTTYAGCSATGLSASCACGGWPNTSDPYCGTTGAACRQRFP